MPNLRGRKEQERSGIDREAESDVEFDFGSAEEGESGYRGSNLSKEPESAEQREDETKKGEKA